MESNNIATWFLGITLIISIIGFFIYLLAKEGIFTSLFAQDGNKKIGIQTGRMDSNKNNKDM